MDIEHTRRLNLWKLLNEQYGTKRVQPSILHQLGIYGGAQGIWRDTSQTSKLIDDPHGVTISILHTGRQYADDLSSDGVLYHYPKTGRHPSFDENEINATKAAGSLKLPIFVISDNSQNNSLRDVYLGWVAGWDDTSELFLILFQSESPGELITQSQDEGRFELFDERPTKRSERKIRPNQTKFHFQVFQRYGAKCALCNVAFSELLHAIHLVPKADRGTDDPRNGLVLCVLHHAAFDAGFFGIEPDSTRIYYHSPLANKNNLGIQYDDLTHLPYQPHKDALEWNWKRFKRLQ